MIFLKIGVNKTYLLNWDFLLIGFAWELHSRFTPVLFKPSNLKVVHTLKPYPFSNPRTLTISVSQLHVLLYLCFILSILRRLDYSEAIQELFSFLGIRTKQDWARKKIDSISKPCYFQEFYILTKLRLIERFFNIGTFILSTTKPFQLYFSGWHWAENNHHQVLAPHQEG